MITYKPTENTGEITGMLIVSDDHDVMLITNEGTIIRIHAADISVLGRATKGVRLMRTSEESFIVGCARTDRDDSEEVAQVESLPEDEDSEDLVLEEDLEAEYEEVEEDAEGEVEENDTEDEGVIIDKKFKQAS